MAVWDVIIVKTDCFTGHTPVAAQLDMITSLISTLNNSSHQVSGDKRKCLEYLLSAVSFHCVWYYMANYYFVSRQGSQWKAVFELVNNFQVRNDKGR